MQKMLGRITNQSWNNLTMLIKNKYGTVSKFMFVKYKKDSFVMQSRFQHWKRGVSAHDSVFTKLVLKEFGVIVEREV